jgi:hypothetical protein
VPSGGNQYGFEQAMMRNSFARMVNLATLTVNLKHYPWTSNWSRRVAVSRKDSIVQNLYSNKLGELARGESAAALAGPIGALRTGPPNYFRRLVVGAALRFLCRQDAGSTLKEKPRRL